MLVGAHRREITSREEYAAVNSVARERIAVISRFVGFIESISKMRSFE